MSSKTYVKILLASFLVGIGISMVGCGGSGGGSNTVPPTGIASPQIAAVYGPTPNSCYGGVVVAALDGTQVCQFKVQDYSFRYRNLPGVPRLNPSNPNAMAAPMRGLVSIQPNDKLTISDVSGGWGNRGPFEDSSCDAVSITGHRQSDGSTLMNESVPSGLFLSTGNVSYPAFGPGVIYLNETGSLRYGFNVPNFSGNCFSLSLRFKIERCLDVASLPHKCK